MCVCVCGWVETINAPYPLKVQARPPRDLRTATQSRISGQGEKERDEATG